MSKNIHQLGRNTFDLIIIGAGVAGPRVALEAVTLGASVLLLEAGEYFPNGQYPQKEIDANARLYWGGGIELNSDASLAILRPKAVGGGSIVNQALLDRFDQSALDSWKENSGVDFFSVSKMAPWYQMAEEKIIHQKIPLEYKNGNAEIFEQGFKNNNYICDVLTRAQKDCRFEKGNDCIECLSGCRIGSKQSSDITAIPKALDLGLNLLSRFEVFDIKESETMVEVRGENRFGEKKTFKGLRVVFAGGAIGNSKILLNSGLLKNLPALGKNFYTHPQSMCLAIYDKKINAQKGPLQSFKSADPNFRKNGFKLENVFAPPVAIAMLLEGLAAKHLKRMKMITHMACVEVAIRDSNPGEIRMLRPGKFKVIKTLNEEDLSREKKGLEAIDNIFKSTGAKEIIRGKFRIGLHLMGGLNMGVSQKSSVVAPDFLIHGSKRMFAVDSSIFPNAPGINPSLTIMALAYKASKEIVEALKRNA